MRCTKSILNKKSFKFSFFCKLRFSLFRIILNKLPTISTFYCFVLNFVRTIFTFLHKINFLLKYMYHHFLIKTYIILYNHIYNFHQFVLNYNMNLFNIHLYIFHFNIHIRYKLILIIQFYLILK